MPGIHVHTSRRYDYVEREKEPVLTVPGSYWLCHKKNIYKFTFKYHRNSRNSKEFNYGKELMKVIRRIIKSQPRQGQQFGTHHLLVTYNHTSWTRQDKMFAMLKFRERTDASAFSRAFILTVKLLTTIPISNNDDEYEDELIVYKKNVDETRWNGAEHHDVNVNVNRVSSEIQKLSTITTDETSSDSSTRLTPINSTNIKVSDNLSATNSTKCNNRPKIKNSASFFADLDDLPLLERYLLEQRDQPEEAQEQTPSQPQSQSTTHQERLNEMQETIDMPYQYLIEREIERSKKQTVNKVNTQKKIINESTEKKLPDNLNGESSLSRIRISSTNATDNTTARSTHITDLVMEGLMFTIRQDQDTITVMEQKTKLEPDEVLENSEKVETKEGGKCLVNSSLLKLENLITKIEKSSSAVKSLRRSDENHKSLLSMSPFYAVGANSTDDHQTPYYLNNEDRATIKPSIYLESNKSEKSKFTVPKPLFDNHINEWNNTELSSVKVNIDNAQTIHNDGIINDINNSNSVDLPTNSIVEPMEESKIDENAIKNYQENSSHQLGHGIDSRSRECDNEINNEEKNINVPLLQKVFPNIEPCENNLCVNDSNLEDASNTLKMTELKSKLKMPRIVSSEIVKFDLSSLRSSRFRRDSNSPNNSNKSIESEEIHKENSFHISSTDQRELQLSNEEKVNNISITSRRRLTAKRRLHGQKNDDEMTETTIEMWKLIQDMKYGVKVVLKRLDLSHITGGIKK